jgi:hypothetical protein
MLQDVHSAKISIGVTAPIGDTTVIAAIPNTWIYVHELMGDLAANGTLAVKAGTRVLATFDLDQGQGLTESDEPGNDNVARFTCRPGEAFILTITGGTFTGTVDYSLRQ